MIRDHDISRNLSELAKNNSDCERCEHALGSVSGSLAESYMSRMVNCVKLNREAEELTFAPLPGELGKRIYENVSQEAWQAWLEHQKMLVNENRLSLADPAARKYLMGQTEQYFFGTGADATSGTVPPAAR